MSNHSRRALKRTAAAAIAALAGATSVALVPGSAGALPGFEFERLDGLDRYATAGEIALEAFPGGTDNVILATGENFPDALAGNYLAGALGAPILLAHHDDVPQATVDALAALDPDTVTLLGGTVALDNSVEAELAGLGYGVDRISGSDRFDTARLIAVQGASSGIGLVGGEETAIVATGGNFPDALAAGPVAYDEGFPILLTPSGSLSPSVSAAIDELNIEHVIILGGDGAINGAVQTAIGGLGVTTERLSGDTRFSTATAIAERAIDDFGFTDAHVDVASGRNFPDALAGGALGGTETAPLVLTEPNSAADETCDFLEGHDDTLATGHALGGTAAVSGAALATLRECAGGEAPNENPRGNQDYNSTPSSPVLGVLGTDGLARQEYTFSDILPGTEVDVTFVPCFAESRDADGNVAIADDPIPQDFFFSLLTGQNNNNVGPFTGIDYLGAGHALYMLGLDNTNILFVNGEVQPGGTHFVDDFNVPASGQLVVEFISIQSDCVIPLVYEDLDGDDRLDLEPDTDLPTDPFAVGNAFVASNGEAANGQEIDGDVMFHNRDENYFVLDDSDTAIVDGNVFFYEDNDDYTYDGDFLPFLSGEFETSMADFNTWLSELDEIDDNGVDDPDYSRNGSNTFEIDDDYSGFTTGINVVMGDFDDDPSDSTSNDALITWDTPDPTDGFIVDYEVDAYDADTGGVFAFFAGFDSDDDPQPTTPPEPNQDVDNDNIDDDVDNELIVEDLPLGNFVFVIHALTGTGDESLFASEPSSTVSSPGAPGAPLSTAITFTDSLINCCGTITAFDIIRISFSEDVVASATATITARDADGTIWRINRTGPPGVDNSDWLDTNNATNDIRIDMTANAQVITAGGNGTPDVPAQILASTGITDLAGNQWNIMDSPDSTIG